MNQSLRTAALLIFVWIGVVFCAATMAQTTTINYTVTQEDGEVYKNAIRFGNGFKSAAECDAYVRATIANDLAAKGDGAKQSDYTCHTVTRIVGIKTVTPAVVATPGLGKLPANPRINVGSGIEQLTPTSEVAFPSSDGTGDFRTVCNGSHFAFDDPIVFPGQPGKSHMHLFFGNTGANANSTSTGLLSSGNSTCRGGIVNRTSYWVPALIDTTTNLPVVPDDSNFYYKSGYEGVRPDQIHPLPAGLRMIAGDSKNAIDDHNPYTLYLPYFWSCRNTANTASKSIPNCPVGDQLSMNVVFPQCWDGVNLDSPDHKSHMAYPVNHNGCPSTHPVALPEVSFIVLYPVVRDKQYAAHRLASDTYTGLAGYSAHADYFMGWRQDISDTWAKNCVVKGVDCHSHLLGDGRAMY